MLDGAGDDEALTAASDIRLQAGDLGPDRRSSPWIRSRASLMRGWLTLTM